jgi:hypothetical protein
MYYNCVHLIPKIITGVCIRYMYKLKASLGKSVISGLKNGKTHVQR